MLIESIGLFHKGQWGVSYRGLPEGLACEGPVGRAQNRTSQHDEI
jgi:hypothetical protein